MTTVKTLMSSPAGRFARHYAEMVVAMFAGMIVLGLPVEMTASGLGVDLHDEAPAAMLLSMGITMTVGMVAWMRYRGHGWAASNEMAASMMVPSLGVVALLAAGAGGGHRHAARHPARRDVPRDAGRDVPPSGRVHARARARISAVRRSSALGPCR
jgi:hypothetical protein